MTSMVETPSQFSHTKIWPVILGCGLLWLVSNAIVWIGIVWANPTGVRREGCWERFARFDGQNYRQILTEGYAYQEGSPSNVAFFPAYPLAGRAISRVTGLAPTPALLMVSQLSLLAAMVTMTAYVRLRRLSEPSSPARWHVACVLLAFGLFPTTFFWHMAYSESLFVLLLLLTMCALECRRPVWHVACLSGAVTAVRPVGMAVAAICLAYIVQETRSKRVRLPMACGAAILTCWGLIAYMTFQWLQFGDALAFAKTQQHWRLIGPVSWSDKLLSLASLEPIWSVYVPDSIAYWRTKAASPHALLSLQFANPLYFVGTAVVVIVGGCKRWLSMNEVWLSAGLLLIPYATRSLEMSMNSHARFAAVVVPVYIVLGRWLAGLSAVTVLMIVAAWGVLLAVYAAQFANGVFSFF